MVPHMQEVELSLLEDVDECIHELIGFGEVEDVNPKEHFAGFVLVLRIANGHEQAALQIE
jgi:hypothetical protein